MILAGGEGSEDSAGDGTVVGMDIIETMSQDNVRCDRVKELGESGFVELGE